MPVSMSEPNQRTTFHITPNSGLVKSLWEDYCKFKKRKTLLESPIVRGYAFFSLVFLVLYFILWHPFLLVASLTALLFIGYWLSKFYLYTRAVLKHVDKMSLAGFEFGYSEDGLYYKTSAREVSYPWSHYGFYELNGSELYLYNPEGNQVIDLISEKISGEQHFALVKALIEKHLKKR
jgi:hypothetical protein